MVGVFVTPPSFHLHIQVLQAANSKSLILEPANPIRIFWISGSMWLKLSAEL